MAKTYHFNMANYLQRLARDLDNEISYLEKQLVNGEGDPGLSAEIIKGKKQRRANMDVSIARALKEQGLLPL